MRRITYHKLIRDRIPEIIADGGRSCKVRRLSGRAALRAVRMKILEEAQELQRARGKGEILNELVDLQELVTALRRRLGVRAGGFARIVRRKETARGGFRKMLFLEYTGTGRR
ncbi:MAG: nucleoside triphosphate pyrophosphohydrolase [Candidatus Aureabacteria bacterium]|nr:nucleoside triphosphate pyrophosphohydrolase [Candidatus Auribacterota bacterium]